MHENHVLVLPDGVVHLLYLAARHTTMCLDKVACRKNLNGKFLHGMLVNWLYGGIRTLLFLLWAITVEPVLKGTCIENKDHFEIPVYTHKVHMCVFVVCAVSKKM